MTTEQLKEFAEALSILSAQSSVMKERTELRALMEESLLVDEVSHILSIQLTIMIITPLSGS